MRRADRSVVLRPQPRVHRAIGRVGEGLEGLPQDPRTPRPHPPPSPHPRGIRPSKGRPSGASPATSWCGSDPVERGRDDGAVPANGSAVGTAGSWRSGPGQWTGFAVGRGTAVGRCAGRYGATWGSCAGVSARCRRHAHLAVCLRHRVSRCRTPIRTHKPTSLRTTPTEAIGAAIAGLVADRAGSDPREIDPPALRPGKDEPRLAGVCLAFCLPAAGRIRPAHAGQDPLPGRQAADRGHSRTAVRAFLSCIHQARAARFGRIDRRSQGCRCALRSDRPKRQTVALRASV
jgi:hypothetical protein